MPIDSDPFSEESLRKLDEWRRSQAMASRGHRSIRGYLVRGLCLALLYGVASTFGPPGVAEAVVIVAIAAYYFGQATAGSTRP